MSKRRGSGDGSIYKRGDRWVACVTVAGPTGQPVRRRRSAQTYQEARTKLHELQGQARNGANGSGRTTVESFLEDWLALQRAGDKSPNTLANYDWAIHHHLIPNLGAIRLVELRPDQVDAMLLRLAESGAAHSTMVRVRAVLSMALKQAERRGAVVRNVAALTDTPAGPKREGRSLTLDEARRLLTAVRGDRLEAAWTIMVLVGLRPGETAGLKWVDFDFDAGTLSVCRARRDQPGGAVLGEPKTPRARRTLDLPELAVDVLRTHRARQAAERLAAGDRWQDHGLTFTTLTGSAIDRWALARAFSKATKAAGLGHWRPGELRHSATSLLSDAGVAAEVVADVLGHAPGSRMTTAVYRHPVRPSVAAAKVVMDGLLGQSPGR